MEEELRQKDRRTGERENGRTELKLGAKTKILRNDGREKKKPRRRDGGDNINREYGGEG